MCAEQAPRPATDDYPPIENYGIIGDLRTFLEMSGSSTGQGAEAVRVGSKVIDSLQSRLMRAP